MHLRKMCKKMRLKIKREIKIFRRREVKHNTIAAIRILCPL